MVIALRAFLLVLWLVQVQVNAIKVQSIEPQPVVLGGMITVTLAPGPGDPSKIDVLFTQVGSNKVIGPFSNIPSNIKPRPVPIINDKSFVGDWTLHIRAPGSSKDLTTDSFNVVEKTVNPPTSPSVPPPITNAPLPTSPVTLGSGPTQKDTQTSPSTSTSPGPLNPSDTANQSSAEPTIPVPPGGEAESTTSSSLIKADIHGTTPSQPGIASQSTTPTTPPSSSQPQSQHPSSGISSSGIAGIIVALLVLILLILGWLFYRRRKSQGRPLSFNRDMMVRPIAQDRHISVASSALSGTIVGHLDGYGYGDKKALLTEEV